MGGDMNKMACVGDQLSQMVICNERFFGSWRHFHEMDVEMQDYRMCLTRRRRNERLQHALHFKRVGAIRNAAALTVPHFQGVWFRIDSAWTAATFASSGNLAKTPAIDAAKASIHGFWSVL